MWRGKIKDNKDSGKWHKIFILWWWRQGEMMNNVMDLENIIFIQRSCFCLEFRGKLESPLGTLTKLRYLVVCMLNFLVCYLFISTMSTYPFYRNIRKGNGISRSLIYSQTSVSGICGWRIYTPQTAAVFLCISFQSMVILYSEDIINIYLTQNLPAHANVSKGEFF